VPKQRDHQGIFFNGTVKKRNRCRVQCTSETAGWHFSFCISLLQDIILLQSVNVYVCMHVKIRRHQHTRVHAHAHTGPRRHARAPACHRHHIRKSIFLLLPLPPPYIAYPIAILMHDHYAIYAPLPSLSFGLTRSLFV